MKKIIRFMTMLAVILMTGCTATQDAHHAQDAPAPRSQKSLRIKVVDGSAATRASMDAWRRVTFQPGDAIGLYILRNGSIEHENIKITYTEEDNSAAWIAEREIDNNISYTYYAYYPYSEDIELSDLTPAATSAQEFFAGYRDGYAFWNSDQSTVDKLMQCDFMVARGIPVKEDAGDDGYLLFQMEHQMALVIMTLKSRRDVERTAVNSEIVYNTQNGYQWTNIKENVNETDLVELAPSTTFYGNTPCRFTSSQYYFIAKPGTETTLTTFHDIPTSQGTGYWTLTLTAPSAGQCVRKEVMTEETSFTVQNLHDNRDYILIPGDYVGSDGSIWKSSDNSSRGQDATPIAMVIQTGYDDPTYNHAMCLGLMELCGTLASRRGGADSSPWSTSADAIVSEQAVLTPTWPEGSTLPSTIYQYVTNPNGTTFTIDGIDYTIQCGQNGLANTMAIQEACADDMTRVPVFNELGNYPLTAFDGSSGWFIPSISELYTLFITFTGVTPENHVKTATSNRWLRYTGTNADNIVSTLNNSLNPLGSGKFDAFYGFGTNSRYWSSTEASDAWAYNVLAGQVNNANELRFDGGYSKTSTLTCRAFLAF